MFYLSIHQYFIPMDVTLVTAKKQNSLQGDAFSLVLQGLRFRKVFFNYFLSSHYFELFFGLCNLSFSLCLFATSSQGCLQQCNHHCTFEIIIFVYYWGSVSYSLSVLYFVSTLYSNVQQFLCPPFCLLVRFFLLLRFAKYKDKQREAF